MPPRNLALPATIPAGRASAASSSRAPAERIVDRNVMAYLKMGAEAMAEARELLDLGPSNQLFASVAQGGSQAMATVLFKDMKFHVDCQAGHLEDDSGGRVATQVVMDYLKDEGILTATPSGHSLACDPSLVELTAAMRSGLCIDYAFVTMLSMMKKVSNERLRCEIRLVWLDKPDDKEHDSDRPWNQSHNVLTVSYPHSDDPEATVILDAWVERTRPLLLSEAQYAGGQREWRTDTPHLKVSFDGRRFQATGLSDDDREVELDVKAWPTIDRLREVQGALSMDDLYDHLASQSSAALAGGDDEKADVINAFRKFLLKHDRTFHDTFQPGTRRWHQPSVNLLHIPTYQMETVPAPAAAHLYRTRSAREAFTPVEQGFGPEFDRALSPQSRRQAVGLVATVDLSPPRTRWWD